MPDWLHENGSDAGSTSSSSSADRRSCSSCSASLASVSTLRRRAPPFFLAWLLAFISARSSPLARSSRPAAGRRGGAGLRHVLGRSSVVVLAQASASRGQSIATSSQDAPNLEDRSPRSSPALAGAPRCVRPRPDRPRGPGERAPDQPQHYAASSSARSSSWPWRASARSATCSSSCSCRCTWSSTATGSCRSCSGSCPPGTCEARLLERASPQSFGGFLRGQAVMGLIYGLLIAPSRASSSGCRSPRSRPPRRGLLMLDPVLRPVRVVAAAGPRRGPVKPDGAAAGPRSSWALGWFVVDERPPAAPHAAAPSASTRSSSSARSSSARRSRGSSAPSSGSRSPRSSRRSSSTTSRRPRERGPWPTGRRPGRASGRAARSAFPREPVPGRADVDEVSRTCRPATASRSRRSPDEAPA